MQLTGRGVRKGMPLHARGKDGQHRLTSVTELLIAGVDRNMWSAIEEICQSVLASLEHPIHNECHNARLACMDRIGTLNHMRKPFIELEKDSRSARYQCVAFTPKHSQAACRHLNEIESALLP